jgi:hypothetical protein
MRFVRAVPWHGPVLSFVNASLEKYELFQKQARTEFDVELFSATSMMSVGVASWRLWKDVPMFTGVGSLSGMGETSMIGFLLALLMLSAKHGVRGKASHATESIIGMDFISQTLSKLSKSNAHSRYRDDRSVEANRVDASDSYQVEIRQTHNDDADRKPPVITVALEVH